MIAKRAPTFAVDGICPGKLIMMASFLCLRPQMSFYRPLPHLNGPDTCTTSASNINPNGVSEITMEILRRRSDGVNASRVACARHAMHKQRDWLTGLAGLVLGVFEPP